MVTSQLGILRPFVIESEDVTEEPGDLLCDESWDFPFAFVNSTDKVDGGLFFLGDLGLFVYIWLACYEQLYPLIDSLRPNHGDLGLNLCWTRGIHNSSILSLLSRTTVLYLARY